MNNLEAGEVAFRLTDPHAVLVEPVRPSGMTQSGIFIIDEEFNNPQETSMFLRVIGGVNPKSSVRLGAVYLCPVYCWEELVFRGETWLITHEQNCLAEIEGYDDWDMGV